MGRNLLLGSYLLGGGLASGALLADDGAGLARARTAMTTLADEQSKVADARAAARELLSLAAEERRRTAASGEVSAALPALLGRFRDPTVAEAMLAALDRELRAIALGDEDPDPQRWHRRETVKDWTDLLVELDDRRIAHDLAERAAAEGDEEVRALLRAAARRLEDAPAGDGP